MIPLFRKAKHTRRHRATAAFSFAATGGLLSLLLPAAARAQSTVTFFSFNSPAPPRTTADIGTGAISSDGAVTAFTGTNVNLQPGFVAGNDFTVQRGAGVPNSTVRTTTFSADTTGFTNIQVSFAAQRSDAGFSANQFQAFNGASFVNVGNAFDPSTNFSLQSFDLSSVFFVNNNPLATFRLLSSGLPSTAAFNSNIRLDNLRVAGTPQTVAAVPEPGTIATLGAMLGGTGLGLVRGRCRLRRRTA